MNYSQHHSWRSTDVVCNAGSGGEELHLRIAPGSDMFEGVVSAHCYHDGNVNT